MSPVLSSWILTSQTVTVNPQVAVSPLGLVAVQLTAVAPTAKLEPDDGAQVMVALSSFDVGDEKLTATVAWSGLAVTAVILAGQAMVSGSLILKIIASVSDWVAPVV